MLEEIQAEQYFTMVFAVVDRVAGRLIWYRRAIRTRMLLRRSGQVVRLGTGGLPVGLLPDARYETSVCPSQPGDRLVLMSDGITECPRQTGTISARRGWPQPFPLGPSGRVPTCLRRWSGTLARQAGTDSFPDDVSGVVLDLLQE
jgi:phosphoserine phosphatase RsbU/P